MHDTFDPKKKHRPASSIDGFIPAHPRGHRQELHLKAFDQYHRPQQPIIPKLDNFRSPDGFSPAVQPHIGRPAEQRRGQEIADPHEKPSAHPLDMGLPTSQLPRHSFLPQEVSQPRKRKIPSFFRKKKSKLPVKHPKRRLLYRGALVFGVLVLLIGAGLFVRAFLTGRGIFKGGGNSALLNNQNVDPTQLKGEGDGRVNILLLGKGGEEQSSGPDLTDTIIIASIDPIAKEAALLSIPRDLWVKSPSGHQSKINQVYADAKTGIFNNYSFNQRDSDEAKQKAESAGIGAIKETVEESMGVPIHYHGMIDFAGFRKAIDTVGGIDINVTEDMAVSERMWLNGRNYNLDVDPGQQHFDGFRALAFSRSRKTSARGDFARSERQRAVILALKDKVLSTGTLANPLKLNQLLSDFGGQVTTDFSINEILRVYDLAKEIPGDKVASAGLDQYVSGDTINNLSVQVPKAGINDFSEIQNYVRNVMRDAFLKSEDAKVLILNGTATSGLATKKSAELKSFGYNVIGVGDAPTETYTQTVLVDLSGSKRYTKNYLEKRLGVQSTGSLPDPAIDAQGADFVIILGSNETSGSQN